MRRSICPNCQFPTRTCLCDDLVYLMSDIPVFILQHPTEQKAHKSTVKILEKCLTPMQLEIGEVFDPIEINLPDPSRCVLVFPELSDTPKAESTAESQDENQETIEAVILIDGTWKKANKIYYSNPWLQSIPKLNISDYGGNYWIRSANAKIKNSMSTLEATVFGLVSLTKDKRYLELLKPLDAFQRKQSEFIPSSHRRESSRD